MLGPGRGKHQLKRGQELTSEGCAWKYGPPSVMATPLHTASLRATAPRWVPGSESKSVAHQSGASTSVLGD
eukprot:509455-Alexandrium_andersonii.AAC.1